MRAQGGRGGRSSDRSADRPGGDARTARPGPGRPTTADQLRALQRLAGNTAVARAVAEERHQHDAHCGHTVGDNGTASVQRSAVHQVLRTPGRPLDTPLRTEMEARLGADFSDVRVHTGADARNSAAEIGARAYTSGSHVVVGEGGADKHTLAHELTHVIQQRRGPVAGTDNGGGLKVSDPGDRFEREAEDNARRVMGAALPERAAGADARDGGPGTETGAAGVQRAPKATAHAPHVQRAPGERESSPERPGSSHSTKSTDSEETSPADVRELRFTVQAGELWQRITKIHALNKAPGFSAGLKAWLANVHEDLKAVDGGAKPPEVNQAAVNAVMAGLHHPTVQGQRLPYEWYVRQQNKPGFQDILTEHAGSSATMGQLWSKMGSATAAEATSVGRGLVLETTVQGRVFDGLDFGLPSWNASPALQRLWFLLSQSYAQGLRGWVDAHVLDGIHETSVLNTIEWPELKKQMAARDADGEPLIDGLNIIVYRAEKGPDGKHTLVPHTSFRVRSQDEFDKVPKAKADKDWYEKQGKVDKEQKEALAQVFSREEEIARLDKYLTSLAVRCGGLKNIRLRKTVTPNNTPAGTQRGSFRL
ncbi:eCIS core domain-containing protein [Streptomyces sp. NPDC002643]